MIAENPLGPPLLTKANKNNRNGIPARVRPAINKPNLFTSVKEVPVISLTDIAFTPLPDISLLP